jgi:hypothetical protein
MGVISHVCFTHFHCLQWSKREKFIFLFLENSLFFLQHLWYWMIDSTDILPKCLLIILLRKKRIQNNCEIKSFILLRQYWRNDFKALSTKLQWRSISYYHVEIKKLCLYVENRVYKTLLRLFLPTHLHQFNKFLRTVWRNFWCQSFISVFKMKEN